MTCRRVGSAIVCGRSARRRVNPLERHPCGWPGCSRQVGADQWGCRPHRFKLPPGLRARLWQALRHGRGAAFRAVDREAREWIAEQLQRAAEPRRTRGQGELFR